MMLETTTSPTVMGFICALPLSGARLSNDGAARNHYSGEVYGVMMAQ